MGLDEHAVDVFEIDDAGLVAHGFDEGAQAEVAGASQQALAGADDQGQAFRREGVVAQPGAVQLAGDEGFDGFGTQARQHDRVGEAGADFFVDGEGQRLEQRRLANEHEVVGVGKVLAEQGQFAQAVGGHEMGVVNDGDEHLADAMDFEGYLDQQAIAAMIAALELNLKGFAKDAQGVVVGVEGAVDDRGDEAFGVVVEEGVFEHAFSGARFAQDQAEAALLGMNAEDVEDLLLVRQQGDGLGVEGLALEAEVGADHNDEFQA